jgi:hypothetical protein
MKDCTKRMTPICNEVQHEAEASGECPKFTAPLPFGGEISSNGHCVNYIPPAAPPEDGTYGKVIVKNGAITGVMNEEVQQYTSSPCAPIPTPCDCQGEGGSLPQPSTVSGNIFGYDAANRPYAVLHADAGDGITISGNGTESNPFVVAANPEALTVALRSGNTAIAVSGTGSGEDPFVVTHKSNDGSQTVNGYSFDTYGHFVSYTKPSDEETALRSLVAGSGINIQRNGAVAIIALAGAVGSGEYVPDGVYRLGAWELKVTDNQLAHLERVITIPETSYNMGGWVVSTDEYGSITGVVEDAHGVALSGKSIRIGNTTITPPVSATINLGRTSGLRVTAICKGSTMPSNVSIAIDGATITTDVMLNQAHALSTAIYGVGNHTVTLSAPSSSSTPVTITGPLYLDIQMVEVV